MTLNNIESYCQISANIATTIGILIAVITYKKESKKDRMEREYGTFNDLDDKYVEFMYKCSENTALDLFPKTHSASIHPILYSYPIIDSFNDEMNQENRIKERALFSVLISIFERAFVMFNYRCHDIKNLRSQQFEGWTECMSTYCTRPSFVYEWVKIGEQFDKGFQNCMEEIINESILKTIQEKDDVKASSSDDCNRKRS